MEKFIDTAKKAVKETVWGQALEQEEKVRVRIPPDANNPEMSTVEVGLNGKFYTLKRGVFLDVPKSIFEILDSSDYL